MRALPLVFMSLGLAGGFSAMVGFDLLSQHAAVMGWANLTMGSCFGWVLRGVSEGKAIGKEDTPE